MRMSRIMQMMMVTMVTTRLVMALLAVKAADHVIMVVL